MTSYHRLAEVGREAGIVLCFSAAVSTRSNIQIQTCRDPGFGTEEELKQASFSCSWVESKASTALQEGRKAAQEVFNDSLPKLHFPVSSGEKDGHVGRGWRCRNSDHWDFCLPSLMSPLPGVTLLSLGGTRWDKPSSATQIPVLKVSKLPLPMTLDPIPSPWWHWRCGSEAREREIWLCRKSESRIGV